MVMKAKRIDSEDPRIQSAVAELQALIQRHYPGATFEETHGEDPEGIYVMATVDVEDTDDVVDVYIDRLLEMQIDENLAVYVAPIRPLERIVAP
jgi:hypothetical protein